MEAKKGITEYMGVGWRLLGGGKRQREKKSTGNEGGGSTKQSMCTNVMLWSITLLFEKLNMW